MGKRCAQELSLSGDLELSLGVMYPNPGKLRKRESGFRFAFVTRGSIRESKDKAKDAYMNPMANQRR